MKNHLRTVTQADVDEGFDSLYNTERILLENTFISHPQSQRLLMRALASRGSHPRLPPVRTSHVRKTFTYRLFEMAQTLR